MKRIVIMPADEYDGVVALLRDALTSQDIGLKYCRNTFLSDAKDEIERALRLLEHEEGEPE